MTASSSISVQFFRPSPALQPYLTAFYLTEIETPAGTLVDDYLHPEWAALRFTEGQPPVASVGPGQLERKWPFVANGPTSRAIHFGVEKSRIWGVGLQPRGWSKFALAPADSLANVTVDGATHPAFANFAALAGCLFDGQGDAAAEARRIDDHLLSLVHLSVAHEEQIAAIHQALLDPETATVGHLTARVGLPAHSLERISRRYFGFAPKLLLRRQRFLRSLAHFMLDPSLNWIGALDSQYHDQAQFVRDFREFMGLTPRQYAALPHPILKPIMRQRMADAGAVEPTDLPTIARYAK
ncbi:helix-turn-helix domain-containing protein [Novosphingobium tardum]|uniref:Helix-turn-helix domain-containing protein n=1 Tax=Novosphingobium tardum TaxID=1538021 RepID=A0ABV8RJY6_9SPHN